MLLSVIVPVYNMEKFIDKCVESIINQSYKDIEIILVDDGSTDNSGNICDIWGEKDDRIVVIHKTNGGLSSARNAGIEVAKGEYVGFVDSDDYIDADMYEDMVDAVINSQKDIIACGQTIELFDQSSKNIHITNRKEYKKMEAIRQVLLEDELDVSACDKIFRRKLFGTILFPVGKISEDAAIVLQLIDASNGVYHVGKPYYHYIYRQESISKAKYHHGKLDALYNCINMKAFLEDKYPNLIREWKIYTCCTSGALLQNMYEDRTAIKKYKQDYQMLLKYYNKTFMSSLFAKSLNWKQKIKFILTYFHLYPIFVEVKRKMR